MELQTHGCMQTKYARNISLMGSHRSSAACLMQICTTSDSVQACSASSCAILHECKSTQICSHRDLCFVGPVQVCSPADLHDYNRLDSTQTCLNTVPCRSTGVDSQGISVSRFRQIPWVSTSGTVRSRLQQQQEKKTARSTPSKRL